MKSEVLWEVNLGDFDFKQWPVWPSLIQPKYTGRQVVVVHLTEAVLLQGEKGQAANLTGGDIPAALPASL